MAKRQTLKYNSEELTQNLKQSAGKGVDVFFPSPFPTPPTSQTKEKKSRVNTPPMPSLSTPSNQISADPESGQPPIDILQKKMVKANNDVVTSQHHEVLTDVMTSALQDINKKLWREIIEETETHNSSLRMSAREREQMEDVVRDLKRKYRIKTSMNEIARLGLLFLIHDFKKRGAQSIITEVKTS